MGALHLVMIVRLITGAAVTNAKERVIDFEQGTSGADAFDLYGSQGVTLPTHPTIVETPQARSGQRALRCGPPLEGSSPEPLTISFKEELDVKRVTLFVGLEDIAPGEQVSIQAEAIAIVPVTVSTQEAPALLMPSVIEVKVLTVTGGPEGGPTPLETRFELSRGSAKSPIAAVRLTALPSTRVILVDDLTFETGSTKTKTKTKGKASR